MTNSDLRVGELLVVGFRGPELPGWLLELEARHGLGAVILFDYDVQTRTYENNVRSREQLEKLCASIARLPSKPLICVDQEGGKVRRLKEKLGFAPLPSAKAFNQLPGGDRLAVAARAFRELRELGFHWNLAPVIDLDLNPENPDIGKVERSFSADPEEVRVNAKIVAEAAREAGLMLCLKHYPGLGGATVNSHHELTDLTPSLLDPKMPEQIQMFSELVREIPGEAILVSHGIIESWDPGVPVSMSARALGELRAKAPDALLVSDDLQMEGLQKKLGSQGATVQGIRAGLDMICIGNNLLPQEAMMAEIAQELLAEAARDASFAARVRESIGRVGARKKQFRG